MLHFKAFKEKIFGTKKGQEKGMKKATKNLVGVQGVSKVTTLAAAAELQRRGGIQIDDFHNWGATQACPEQEIPFSKCQRYKIRCIYEWKVWYVQHQKLRGSGPNLVSWSLHCIVPQK